MSEPLQIEALKLALEFVEKNHLGGHDAFQLIATIEEALMTFQGGAQQSKGQREWVGLTLADKEQYISLDFGGNRLDAMDFAEKRLKEKNT